jgi:hypothetical protein
MTRYTADVIVCQHRTHLFTVFITKDKVHLMRWDHCGAILSQKFNYIDDPKWLLNFFHHLANLNPTEQGYDSSVQPATKDQIDGLRHYRESIGNRENKPGCSNNYRLKAYLDEMNKNHVTWPIMQVNLCALLAMIHAHMPRPASMPGLYRSTGRGSTQASKQVWQLRYTLD